ncbi:MAG: hypothetical protein VXX72_08135, partial [Pseudomonadota bacterium]|nr:hypothetical protein [Pseudomonadota bacterium]
GLAFITRNFDVIDAAGRAIVDVLVAPFKAMLEGIQSTVEPLNSFEADFRATFAIVTKVLTDLTNNVLTPLFKFVGKIFGQILTWLGQLVGAVAGAMDSIASTVTSALRTLAGAIQAFINASPVGLLRLFGIDAGAAVGNGIRTFADGLDQLKDSGEGYTAVLAAAGQAAVDAANGGGSLPGGKNAFAGAGPRNAAGVAGANGGGSKGGGRGAGRASQLPQLKQATAYAQQLLDVERQILDAQLQEDSALIRQLEQQKLLIEYENEKAKIMLEAIPALEQQEKLKQASIEYTREQLELENQIKTEERDRLQTLEDMMTQFDREIELAGIKDELARDLKQIEYDIIDLRKQGLLVGEQEIAQYRAKAQAAAQARNGGGKIQQYMDGLRAELADTEGMVVSLAKTVEGEIGSAMANAITGLIDGTQTAQEAFSNMFKNIGAAFIEMATQMIAKALVMKALGILTGGGGGVAGGGMGSFFPLGQGFSYAGGGYTGNAPRSGGVDGKGGFPAILHPQETVIDHHGAMSRYSPGGAAGGGHRTISFQSEVINNVEYVTAEQAMAMSRAAADDGAKRGAAGGHARSMSTLRNSRSQRAKLGIK